MASATVSMLQIMMSFNEGKGDEVFFIRFKDHLEEPDDCTRFIENIEYVRGMQLSRFKKYLVVSALLDASDDSDVREVIGNIHNLEITTSVLNMIVKMDKHDYDLHDIKLK